MDYGVALKTGERGTPGRECRLDGSAGRSALVTGQSSHEQGVLLSDGVVHLSIDQPTLCRFGFHETSLISRC
jgi:hypothetical protein